METHIFRLPIIYKILMLFFSAFFVYSLVIINDLYWLFVLAAASFLGGFYFLNVTYIFESNNLKIKLPFLKAKTYNLQNLIGYSFDSMSGETKLHLFFQDNKKAVLEFSGKKLKNYLILFLKEKHSFIEEKNIQELIENGLQFKLNKKQEIIFKKFYIELTENGIPAKSILMIQL